MSPLSGNILLGTGTNLTRTLQSKQIGRDCQICLYKSHQPCFYRDKTWKKRLFWQCSIKGKEVQFLNAFTMSQNRQWFTENTDRFYRVCGASHTEPPQLTGEPARSQPGSRGGGSNEDDYRFWNADFTPSFLSDCRNCALKQTECGEALLKAVDTVQMRSQIRRDVPVNEHRAVEQCKTVNFKYSSQHFSSFSSRNSIAESFIC